MRLIHRSLSCAGAVVIAACSTPIAGTDGGVLLPDTFSRPDAARPDAGQQLEVINVLVRDEADGIVGANVVIDDANGEREVAITGAGGHVMVPHVAWGTGRITITAQAPGHPIQSLASFRHADLGARVDANGAINVVLVSYYHAFGVSGNITNSADPSRPVHLYLDTYGQLTVTGTTFAGEVQRNVPFHVWAIDDIYTAISGYHYTLQPVALVGVAHPALAAATTFDIDMSAALPLTTSTGSFPIPADGNPAQAGLGGIAVTTNESQGAARLGFASEMSLAADGTSFDFTVSELATIDTGTPVTLYYVQTLSLYSEIFADGIPTSHPIASGSLWPVPPMLVTPARGSTAGLHDPITLMDVDSTMPVTLTLATDRYTLWLLDLPAGGSATSIPAPPDGTDMTDWTGMKVYVSSCEPWAGHRIACRRDAGGDSFSVAP